MIAAVYTIGGLLAFLVLLSLALLFASRRQFLDHSGRYVPQPLHVSNVAGGRAPVIRKTGATYP